VKLTPRAIPAAKVTIKAPKSDVQHSET